jgi:hypothetical protein
MTSKKSYNQYLTEGIINETIKTIYKDGVRVYLVRAPKLGELVMGHTNLSGLVIPKTITQEAAVD